MWQADGRHLVYRVGRVFYRATVKLAPLAITARDSLFTATFERTAGYRNVDIVPNGEALLTTAPRGKRLESSRVDVLTNFPTRVTRARSDGARK